MIKNSLLALLFTVSALAQTQRGVTFDSGSKVVAQTGLIFSNATLQGSTLVSSGTNTARPLEERFYEVINVLDKGALTATGNDDTLAFQRAINTATLEGKCVYAPPGRYRVGTLYLTAPLTGAGDATIIEPTLGNSVAMVANYVGLKDLQIYSYSYTASYATNAPLTNIFLNNVTIRFDPSVVNDISDPNPLIFKSPQVFDTLFTDGLRIQNCRFYRGGMYHTRANNALIQGNYWDGEFYNINELIHLSSNSHFIISDNVFYRSAADPIDCYSSGSGCRIVNNLIDGWGDPSLTFLRRHDPVHEPRTTAPGFNECAITLKLIIATQYGDNTSGPAQGWTENNIISGNTIRNGVPTTEDARVWAIMIKAEDVSLPAGNQKWALTNASRNIIVANNIIDGFWTNNVTPFNNNFFSGIHVDGSGIDVSHNIVRNISMQGNGGIASQSSAVELGFTYGSPVGTAAIGCTVSHNIFEGEGSGIIIYNATNCVIEANIAQMDYATGNNARPLRPRYGMIIFGNVSQCIIRGNNFDPTFLNPGGILQLGTTNYIEDTLFDGNITSKRPGIALQWFFPRIRDCTFVNNLMGPTSLGAASADGVIMSGNSLMGNSVFGNAALPGFDLHGQKNFQIIGNKFTNVLRAINLRGGSSGTDTDVGLVLNNLSMGENGSFIDMGSPAIATAQANRIIRFNNFANNSLKPSGGIMNLGGQINTGPIVTSGFIQIPASSSYGWASGALMVSSVDNVINMFGTTPAGGFTTLNWGGNTATDMGLSRALAGGIGGLHLKSGNSGAYTNFFAKNAILADVIPGLGQYVVVRPDGRMTNAPSRRAFTLKLDRVAGVGMNAGTDITLNGYARVKFTGATALTNSNHAEWSTVVPRWFANGVGQDVVVEYLQFKTTGNQTGPITFDIGMADIADSAPADPTTFINWIPMTSATLTTPTSGDSFTIAGQILTGWRSAITPGHRLKIRMDRNDANGDAVELTDMIITYYENVFPPVVVNELLQPDLTPTGSMRTALLLIVLFLSGCNVRVKQTQEVSFGVPFSFHHSYHHQVTNAPAGPQCQ